MITPVLPGSVIGVLGGGQLGRMLAVAARRLGYGVHVYSPKRDSPAGAVCDREFAATWEDEDALRRFASSVDVVTLEFENIPVSAINTIAQQVPVHPGAEVLATAQNRLREKNWLHQHGLPTAPFLLARTPAELETAISDLGGRGILKTTTSGYDGRGQWRVSGSEDWPRLWEELKLPEVLAEGIVEFAREFSVIGARRVDGQACCYEPIVNHHHDHILDVSVSPADELPPRIRSEAMEMTQTVMEQLDYVGVLCVEFFQTTDDLPIVNEIAPRPHNSGHLTIEAHRTCQFEQQVRAICGLPLGSTEQRQPAAMANLLGNIWTQHAAPDWCSVLEWPAVKLHLYGKNDPQPQRKMGHITALASGAAAAEQMVRDARVSLQHAPPSCPDAASPVEGCESDFSRH